MRYDRIRDERNALHESITIAIVAERDAARAEVARLQEVNAQMAWAIKGLLSGIYQDLYNNNQNPSGFLQQRIEDAQSALAAAKPEAKGE